MQVFYREDEPIALQHGLRLLVSGSGSVGYFSWEALLTKLLLAFTEKNAPSVPFAALAILGAPQPPPPPPPLVCVALQGADFVSASNSCVAVLSKVSQSLGAPPWHVCIMSYV